MEDVEHWSTITLADAIAARQVSSREALDHLLARIERFDGPINAVVTIDADRARAEAAAADEAIAHGSSTGPLHGVPMTIKDSWETAGMRTTSGAPELADHVPALDAAPVARLRAAGAVVFGKTNLPLYAGDCQSYNDVFGTTNNPYDVTRSCGGSSGGAGAALACGFTPLELGSDIGGSIRGPAHVNGVVGHKPSYGIVPAHGQIPGPPGTLSQADIAVAGPMARTVEDCELALDLLAGPDRWNHPAWRLELPPPRPQSLPQYRIGVWADDAACPVGRDVRELVESAAGQLEGAGAVVDAEVRPAFSFDAAAATFDALLAAALSGGYPKSSFERMAAVSGDADDDVSHTRRLTAMRHREWLSHNERRLQHRQRWAELFAEWDAVLLPVMPVPAIPHDHSVPMAARTIEVDGQTRPYLDLMRWVGIVGVACLPATVVPIGLTATGLPVGVQVVGAYLHDRTTLDLARQLLALLGGCPRPPGL
ncbi:MAG TPA: amidase [Acidimicrobiales bacterium]|jgi:amidase|nr:amidase [Acidimicrobiales bacterium]